MSGAGDSADPGDADERDDGLQVSEAGSSFRGAETSAGGADAVPNTPDEVPAETPPE